MGPEVLAGSRTETCEVDLPPGRRRGSEEYWGQWLVGGKWESADPGRRGDRPGEHRERGAERPCEAQRLVAAPPEDTGTPLLPRRPGGDS
ncbi:hypothetical protein NDU88_009355 [Pleurodeles waltl]|uniref:Uncharacterized protein n=1 Tax=Pleurodeles waltl TaxID=8319 RepID=A0AAV7PUS5_PLEWA|nr:hypothetical protein NDU88_009355 [Pleurodeles waltl]